MKLRELGVLADENIHPAVVAFLRDRGLDARSVVEAKLAGALDTEVLEFALQEKRFVLTHDADLGQIAAGRGGAFCGVVYVRPGHIRPEFTIASLRVLLERNPDVELPFIIAVRRSGARVTVRVRHVR